jgi:hypothetical protein
MHGPGVAGAGIGREAVPDRDLVGVIKHFGGARAGLRQDLLAAALGLVSHLPAVSVGVGHVAIGGLLGLGQEADGLVVDVRWLLRARHWPGVVRPARDRHRYGHRGRGGDGGAQRRHAGWQRRHTGWHRRHTGWQRGPAADLADGPGPARVAGRSLAGVAGRGLAGVAGRGPAGVAGVGPAAQPVHLGLEGGPLLQQQGQLLLNLVAELPHVVLVQPAAAQAGQPERHRPHPAGRQAGVSRRS